MDRLVMELKLPLNDAYFKIRHTLDEVNIQVASNSFFKGKGKSSSGNSEQLHEQISPSKGNVVFASTIFGALFSLESVARKYAKLQAPRPVA